MNVLFDFGGVVFRWRPAALLARVLPERVRAAGGEAAAARDFFVGGGDWNEFDRGALDVDALVERIATRLAWAPADVRRIVDAVPAELAPVPETVDWMRRLRDAGHRLYYLSNMPRPYAAHLLRSHAFLDWFDDGVFSSHVQLIKPDPALFEHALRRFGVVPRDTLFFDDHAPNVDAARAAGLHAVLWTGAAQAEAQARVLGIDVPQAYKAQCGDAALEPADKGETP